jgi:hypothetical protein
MDPSMQTHRAACGGDGHCADSDSSVDLLTQLSSLQSDGLIQYGARLIVIGELLEAILVSLRPEMRADVRTAFGARIAFRGREKTDSAAGEPRSPKRRGAL